MPRRAILTLCSLTLLTLSACRTEPLASGQLPSVVATYAGGEVTREEYASWLDSRKLDDAPDERPARCEQIALTEHLAARALKRAADQDPGTRILIAQAEGRLLFDALAEHLGAEISFTDEEARTAFDSNPENAFKPRRWRLRNLFKKAPEDPARRDLVRREMAQIRAELLAGADFAELARRESESQTRFSGGNMGFVEPDDLRPEIAAAVVELEPGEISEVIETEEGWTILTCYGFQEERRNRFEDVAETVHQILRRREVRRRMARLEAELVAAAGARYELGTARRESAPADAVVLRFAGGRLSVAELDRLLAERRPGAPPRSEMAPEALQQVMDRYLFLVMAGRRARELGLDDDPPLRHRIFWKRAEILALSEIEWQVRDRLVPPTEGEIRAFFENHRQVFRHPPEYELAVIRLRADRASRRARSRAAEELVADLRAGRREFAEAARAHSDHPSAAGGGELGWVSGTELLGGGMELSQTITEMQPGEISDPVGRRTELWIVRLNDRREGRRMGYSEARRRAENRLGNERVKALQREIEDQLRAELELTVLEQ